VLVGAGHPAQEARHAAEGFLANVDADPNWRGLYQEFAVHATRNEAFRLEFVARQRGLRERMAAVFARWASDLGVASPVPAADVAAMTFCMADGFLLDRLVDPELDDALYGAMIEVFLHGLVAMTEAGAGSPSVAASSAPDTTTSDTTAADTVASDTVAT
jgi:hypothetical protein